MRLICPNCGAQYEVADDVIPVAGRDVQCSNCGHTWFERPGASEAAEAGEALPHLEPAPEQAEVVAAMPDPEPQPELIPEPEPEPEIPSEAEPEIPFEPTPAPEPEPAPIPDADPIPAFDPVAIAAAAAVPRRGLSEDLAEMLRQEAAREAEARAAEAVARPQNPVSGTSFSDDQRDDDVRLRTARLRGEEPSKPITAAARRELLPDIEMINSSLRPATEYGTMDTTTEPVAQARKRGARFGFTTVMLIVAILVGLYIGAPRLSALVPAAEPVLTRYVAVVNDVRLWIDLKMQAFIADQSTPATPEPVGGDTTAAPATETPATETPATETPATEAPTPETPATDSPAEPAIDAIPVAPVAPATDDSSG